MSKDNDGRAALFRTAVRKRDKITIAKNLLGCRAQTEIRSKDCFTVLHIAARSDSVNVVK